MELDYLIDIAAEAAAKHDPPQPSFNVPSLNSTLAFLRSLSANDLTKFPSRIAAQIDRTFLHAIPRNVLRASGLEGWADRTDGALNTFASTAPTTAGIEAVANTAAQAMEEAAQAVSTGWRGYLSEAFQTNTFKSYWGMLHYLTSRWAFTCFTMGLILNRVTIYGSSRQRIFLTWGKRLALRIIPIVLMCAQIRSLLLAIRCQSAPEYALYRHGSMNKFSVLDWAPEGGMLHTLSSTLLWTSTDLDACAAVGMSRPSPDVRAPYGSFSLLWPTFLRLCLSHFIETISCSLQQQPVMTEVGMSVFEHSLAFAEAEAMISNTLGLGLFGLAKSNGNAQSSNETLVPASGTVLALADAANSLTGPHILDRVNVPTEVLLVALLSCCNSLTSNIIAVFNKQRSLRLLNTGFWGVCFMASFVWGFCNTSTMIRTSADGQIEDMRPVSGLLHFPTVAIIGFLPHVVILLGMAVCVCIYIIALTLTALSLHTNPNIPRASGFFDRWKLAHENLQAAIQVRGINIKWHEDFYTALVRIGFAALMAASEAVFLNEGRSVEVRQFTWLEEDRLDEIEASRAGLAPVGEASHFQIAEEYGLPPSFPGAADRGGKWESGYAKERKLEKEKEGVQTSSNSIVYPHPRSGGVGALQRTTRFYLLFIYMRGILFVMAGYLAYGVGVTRSDGDYTATDMAQAYRRQLSQASGRGARQDWGARPQNQHIGFLVFKWRG